MIKLQQSNCLKFVTSKTHRKACAQFIEILANIIRAGIKNILQTLNFFSSLFNGPQPKKTFSEKELLYAKVVIRGKAVELLCKCIHMDNYGSDAVDLKHTFDEIIKDTYKIPLDRFFNLIISVSTDGASVNMGIYTGACTQIKNDGQYWLLKIHCANHCLELAIASVYTGQPDYKIVDSSLLNIYQLFKNSGKLRQFLIPLPLIWV